MVTMMMKDYFERVNIIEINNMDDDNNNEAHGSSGKNNRPNTHEFVKCRLNVVLFPDTSIVECYFLTASSFKKIPC